MKAAVVGVGPHGTRVVQIVSQTPGLELAGVVDQNESALALLNVPPDVRRCRSLAELVRKASIDLVCIATNAPSHSALAIEAMRLGIRRVLVEKPMACSVDECQQAIDVAAGCNARLSVDHSRRHAPIYRWIREKIVSGDWGELRSMWIQRPGIGLGCLGTHSFDLACFLFDKPVRFVTAWVDQPLGKNPRGAQFIDPGGLVILDFGASQRAVVTQIEDGAGPMSVELDLTGARIRLDEKSGAVEIIERDLSVVPGPGRPPVFRTAILPDGLTGKTDMLQMTAAIILELAGNDGLECDAIHGRTSIEILVAAHVSHQQGHVPIAPAQLTAEQRGLWLPVT